MHYMSTMALPVIEFQVQGYKISKVGGGAKKLSEVAVKWPTNNVVSIFADKTISYY